MPRITCITRIWQAKACFFKHELFFFEHRKKRKTQKCKLKLGKTLAENAEGYGQAYFLAESAETAEFTFNFQLL